MHRRWRCVRPTRCQMVCCSMPLDAAVHHAGHWLAGWLMLRVQGSYQQQTIAVKLCSYITGACSRRDSISS